MDARYCMGCMEPLPAGTSVCPHCQFDSEHTHNAIHHLPYTVLAGKYLVGRVLGQGGFGITYIGLDLNLLVKVAIKEYYPRFSVGRTSTTDCTVTPFTCEDGQLFEEGKAKFLEEARTLARYGRDQAVVNVRDFFSEFGTAYIVMDFVEGETLGKLGQQPVDELLALLRPVAQELMHLHKQGLIHRDISPDNIIVQKNGQAVLLDFGAARTFAADGKAQAYTVNLKPGYAPLEQHLTSSVQGPFTDVYAFCATIYAMITQEKPPPAVERHMNLETLVPPSQLGVTISPAQEAALLHGLAVQAEERTQTMGQLIQELFDSEGCPADERPQKQAPEALPEDEPTIITRPIDAGKPVRPVWYLGVLLALAVRQIMYYLMGMSYVSLYELMSLYWQQILLCTLPIVCVGLLACVSRRLKSKALLAICGVSAAAQLFAVGMLYLREPQIMIWTVCILLALTGIAVALALLHQHPQKSQIWPAGLVLVTVLMVFSFANRAPVISSISIDDGWDVQSYRIGEGQRITINSMNTGSSSLFIPCVYDGTIASAVELSLHMEEELAAEQISFSPGTLEIANQLATPNSAHFGRVQQITLPTSLQAIAPYTFSDFPALERVVFSANQLETLSEGVFAGCVSLKTVENLSSSLHTVENDAFRDCTSLKELELPAQVSSIGAWAFAGCESLERMSLPNQLESLGEGAFAGCTALQEVILPDGLKRIEAQTFADCKNLKTLFVSSAVEWIGEDAFSTKTRIITDAKNSVVVDYCKKNRIKYKIEE